MDDDEPNVVTLKPSRTTIQEAETATGDGLNASVLTAEIERPLNEALTVTVTVVGTGFDASALTQVADEADTYTATLTIAANATSSDPAGDGSGSIVTITAVNTGEEVTDADDHTVMISGEATPDDGLEGPAAVTLTIEDDDGAPGAISDLDADAAAPVSGNTEVAVTLTWTDPADLGMVDGTATTATTVTYEVRTRLLGQGSWEAWAPFTTAPTAGTAGNAGKMVGEVMSDVDRTHEYQVRAVANDGTTAGPQGPDSNTASAVIPAAPTS